MAGRYGPNIITDNLKFYVDAANKESYPQTGTTWTDLSGEGNDGTISGATFTSENSKNSVSGGTITNDGEYIIHTFTNDSASENFITDVALTADVLIIAGGGGGGMDMGGGGGAGGLIYRQGITISAGTNAIVVGSGGAGAPAGGTGGQPSGHEFTVNATAGEDTTALGYTADGGGYGGTARWNGSGGSPVSGSAGGVPSSGGSGGGASGYGYGGNGDNGTNYLAGGAISTAGQGYAGGQGRVGYYSGGGGGASEAGYNFDINPSYAEGGDGIQINIDGNNYYWAGGGGGAAYSKDRGGHGGEGGGGGGSVGTTTGGSGINAGSAGGGGSPNAWAQTPGGDAGANTGGGGGGGGHYNSNNKGGDGGSGIVIVRYHRSFAPRRFFMDFDGTNDKITINPALTFTDGQEWTFSAWVFCTSSASDPTWEALAGAGSSDGFIMLHSSFTIYFRGNSADAIYSTAMSSIPTNRWLNIVVLSTGTNINFYVDAASLGGGANDTYMSFRDFGTGQGQIRWWEGEISNVMVYNRALSAAEILQNYNAQKGRYGL